MLKAVKHNRELLIEDREADKYYKDGYDIYNEDCTEVVKKHISDSDMVVALTQENNALKAEVKRLEAELETAKADADLLRDSLAATSKKSSRTKKAAAVEEG